jgi:hypothetical protein
MDENNFDYEDFFELSPDLLIISTFDGYYKKVNSSVLKRSFLASQSIILFTPMIAKILLALEIS